VHGIVWALPAGTHLIEGSVVEATDGCVTMMLRTAKGVAYATTSCDVGISWSAAAPMRRLPNPDSKMHVLRWNAPLADGANSSRGVLAAYNHQKASARPPTSARAVLCCAWFAAVAPQALGLT
jgi:hypothetical protein